MLEVSVIVPVYRSQESLSELHQRLTEVLTSQGLRFEIIFVEDCGGDNSWQLIKEIAGRDERVKGLRMMRNFGQHNALLAGIREARGKVIATLDDDLQHPPEELPRLLQQIGNGHDVVYGSPKRQQHGLYRDMASQITKIVLQGAMGAKTARHVSAFRVFRTELRRAFEEYRSPSVNIDVLLTWATTRFTSIPVTHEARKYGQSGYSARKLIKHAINMMTGFSTMPLKLASVIGFLFAIFGGLVLAYVLMAYLIFGDSVPGFPFLASIIALFSGAQLLAIGIIGEYLARIYQRTIERPAYLLREAIPAPENEQTRGYDVFSRN